MNCPNVEEFVKNRVPPELQPIVAMIRNLTELNEDALRYYIKPALEFDAQ